MAKSKKKQNQETLSKINNFWSAAQEERKNYDWKWYLYGLWTRGYHYARYDSNTKRIISKPVKDGRPKIAINKIYPTLRSVRNYVLRNQPKAQVTPDTTREGALKETLKANKFLDYIHESEKLRPKLKNTLWQALEDSVSWWQVLWTGDKIEVNPVDVFDFYPDPKARSAGEMKYGILAVRRRLSDLLDDDKYIKSEVEKIKSDDKRSSSTYKEMLMSFDRPDSGKSKEDKDGTVIVKEAWYIEDGKVYVAAMAGERLIREPEEVDSPIIPFFKLASDIMPFQMYGEGWVKNLIDPQKLLNSAMSSIAEYNKMMNKIKYVTDKGAGVRIVNNKHGQIIEKKRGYNMTTQPVAPISAAVYQQIDYANRFMEDIGSMHDASSGRVPTGAKSGRAIEALQIGDSNNMSEVIENVEDFLEDVYEYILYLASKNYQEMQNILAKDFMGQREYLKVLGEDSIVAQQMIEAGKVPEDTLIISEKNVVDVKITSWLSHSPEAKRESVKELATIIPDLPPEVILDAFGVGNIADTIQKIKEKQAEDKQEALAQQEQESQIQQKAGAPPKSGGQEAFAAMRTIISGGAPQVPANPGPGYIEAIDRFIRERSQELDEQVLQALQTFRDQVVQGIGR